MLHVCTTLSSVIKNILCRILIGFYCLLEYLIISTSGMNSIRGRVAQSVTCLVTDAKLTADPGVASSIPARSHTTLSNPAVGETVLTPVKWCCNTGEVPIRIKKTDGRTDIR